MPHPLHKPGLSKCSPERLERDKLAAAAFDRWMQTSHASNAEIAEAMARRSSAARPRARPMLR